MNRREVFNKEIPAHRARTGNVEVAFAWIGNDSHSFVALKEEDRRRMGIGEDQEVWVRTIVTVKDEPKVGSLKDPISLRAARAAIHVWSFKSKIAS